MKSPIFAIFTLHIHYLLRKQRRVIFISFRFLSYKTRFCLKYLISEHVNTHLTSVYI